MPFPLQAQPIRPLVDCHLLQDSLGQEPPLYLLVSQSAHHSSSTQCAFWFRASLLTSSFSSFNLKGRSESPITHCPQVPSRVTLLSYLVADSELEDKSPSWGDPSLGIEKLPDALLLLPQTAINHQLKQGVRRHFCFSMFLLYSVKMYAN